MLNRKYDFVIFSTELDYYRVMFEDSIEMENVEYIPNSFTYYGEPRWKRVLYDYHFSGYTNYFFEIPLKGIWNRYLYQGEDNGNKCFIFFMDILKKRYIPWFKYLKNHYKNCKLVVYLIDIVSSRKGGLDLSIIEEYMDLAITYDKGDAEKYNFLYYPTFLNKIEVSNDDSFPESDFCFVGAAKNRLTEIEAMYINLKRQGYLCDFVVYNPLNYDIGEKEIQSKNSYISYRDYIRHIINTKCIVEFQQENAIGFTLRTWEALLYNKRLLTNNEYIKSAGFYTPEQFMYFEDAKRVNIKKELWNRSIKSNEETIKERNSVHFLSFVSSNL